jgi:hypothetical protein
LVDSAGESWTLLPEEMALAPAFVVRRWRKADVIRLFNGSRSASETGLHYPESLIPSGDSKRSLAISSGFYWRGRVLKSVVKPRACNAKADYEFE